MKVEIKEVDMFEELNMVIKIKDEYAKGDIVMSELLRNEECDGITRFSKRYLLKWAGEDDYMTVDADGNIVEIERRD